MPNDAASSPPAGLPNEVSRVLDDFVAAARDALGPDLVAIVLFGSAAEGRLRPTSDVNVLVVLSQFARERIDALRTVARSAEAAIRLSPMFVLASEIAGAVEAFADKFADIRRRRRVLFGVDPFIALEVPRAALIARERQSMLNLAIRLRHAYVLRSLRGEQASAIIADFTGPLRVAAAVLCELGGTPAPSTKEALKAVVERWGDTASLADLESLSVAREQGILPGEEAARILFGLIALASRLRDEFSRLEA